MFLVLRQGRREADGSHRGFHCSSLFLTFYCPEPVLYVSRKEKNKWDLVNKKHGFYLSHFLGHMCLRVKGSRGSIMALQLYFGYDTYFVIFLKKVLCNS